jgi:hypothetical protein
VAGAESGGCVVSSKYDAAIDKGIALLDAKVPEWCTKMQLDHLNLQRPRSCVLGQIFGSYTKGLDAILWIKGEDNRDANPSDYGFDIDFDGVYLQLTRRWKQRIRQHCEDAS